MPAPFKRAGGTTTTSQNVHRPIRNDLQSVQIPEALQIDLHDLQEPWNAWNHNRSLESRNEVAFRQIRGTCESTGVVDVALCPGLQRAPAVSLKPVEKGGSKRKWESKKLHDQNSGQSKLNSNLQVPGLFDV